jgi:competence protein ComGC
MRTTKATNILRKLVVIGDTDVSRKIFSIIIMLLVLIYISAGMFLVLENFDTILNPVPYKFNETVYFIVVTLSTVGYGNIYPKTN